MTEPIYIAFVWHMHQPYYRDLIKDEAVLPWVRLHGIKDYYDMVGILEEFPEIHQTFNLVPSLIDQINDYISGKTDYYLEVSKKRPSDLSQKEREFILLNFFMANWDNMVKVYPRYYDLLLKRGRYIAPSEIDAIQKRFSDEEILDLQVWFNLTWFDPLFKGQDHILKELITKGSHFTQEDKEYVLQKQIEVLEKIIPLYRSFQDRGQIEVSISPYYHPILPLVHNSDIARVASPAAVLPGQISFPEDVTWHVNQAVACYQKHFGKKPKGMWPSEGSVSEEILPAIMDTGLKWIATDETILFRSLKQPKRPELLYQPYCLKRNGRRLNIIFRDHELSDLIGFSYWRLSAAEAVKDFFRRLERIRQEIEQDKGPHLIPIILDGENAWEYYPSDGWDFLRLLYQKLSRDDSVRLVTANQFLSENPPVSNLDWLYPGSWIGGNFLIWIGQEEKNRAWEYLKSARQALVEFQNTNQSSRTPEKLNMAWRQIYIAEGSDWNWWYGPENSSANDDEFDRLFRKHLENVYLLINQNVPDYLYAPIAKIELRPGLEPVGFIHPHIDGLVTDYYEWSLAGMIDRRQSGGAMHQAEGVIQAVYYGFDLKNLYLRCDLATLNENIKDKTLRLIFSFEPSLTRRIELIISGQRQLTSAWLQTKSKAGVYQNDHSLNTVALKKILEMAVAFELMRVKSGDVLDVSVEVQADSVMLERWPVVGGIRITVPDENYEAYYWTA